MQRMATDGRLDPRFRREAARVLEVMRARGLKDPSRVPPLEPPPSVEEAWGAEGLDARTLEIRSEPDGNTLKLAFYRPRSGTAALPLVLHMHGGGMAVDSAYSPRIARRCRMLAHHGVVVVGVNFRNSLHPSEPGEEVKPFPAGLNDCYSGLLWCHANAASLGADPKRITLCGESGGSNLCIAMALTAKREGRLDLIKGIYAFCPYIAGTWPQDVRHEGILGESHIENNGITLNLAGSKTGSYASRLYGGFGDPLAWPGFATVEDLRGLPRTAIVVNECDPLRDEGIMFYRRCLAAGVRATCYEVLGTPHTGDINIAVAPDLAIASYHRTAAFAHDARNSTL